MGKSKNTRYYNKFKWHSVSGCDCKWCKYYRGKKRGCVLEECCCAEERAEAYKRERENRKAAADRKKRMEIDHDAGCYE